MNNKPCPHCGRIRTKTKQNELGFCIRDNCQKRYEKDLKNTIPAIPIHTIPVKKSWAEIYKNY